MMTTKTIVAVVERLNEDAKTEFAYHLARVAISMVGKKMPNIQNVMINKAWASFIKSLN